MLVSLKKLPHAHELIAVLLQNITVLVLKLVADSGPGLNIVKVVEKIEGAGSGVEVLAEGAVDERDGLIFDTVDGAGEVFEGSLPVLLVLRQEDVVDEV